MRQDLLKVGGFAFGALIFLVCRGSGLHGDMAIVGGLIAWMAFWWFTEAVDLYVTSLLPIVILPFTGVMSMDEIAPLYMKQIIFLFIGGFLFAFAMERWDLHRRIALRILLFTQGSASKVLLGFMLSSYLLSMWILNTATVTMLLPAVLAVTGELGSKLQGKSSTSAPYLLGLAFASSIGGMATIIGTAPNIIFMEAYNDLPNQNTPIHFANWISFAFPLSLILFVACFFVIRLLFRQQIRSTAVDLQVIRDSYQTLGKIKFEERMLLMIFLMLVGAWLTMKDIHVGSSTIEGWGSWFTQIDESGKSTEYVKESTVAMLGALLLFFIPARKEKAYLLTWQEARRIPIGVIFLFGAGFTIGRAMEVSGLSKEISLTLQDAAGLPPLLLVLLACVAMTFLTELASNTATIFLFLPVMFAMEPYLQCHPLQFYIPVTLSASCAFMLPVATPPNTIIFGSEQVSIKQMISTGFWLNLAAILIIGTLGYWLIGMMV